MSHEEDAEEDAPEEVEEALSSLHPLNVENKACALPCDQVVELLLSALRDSETVVRWAAAKGVGLGPSWVAAPRLFCSS